MRAAIAASVQVQGTTSPNPPVGAVILNPTGEMVGVGATQPPGGPHAEVMALRAAGERAKGGIAVVTLEPCAHYGRTPPCTDALIKAGVRAVIYAVADPNPVASGGGTLLRAAGISVESGLLANVVARGPLRAWLHFARTSRPHVTWKYASCLDGRVAAADGTYRWISSEDSRAQVHDLRRRVDVIMAGIGTIRADDPQLTARTDDGALASRQPLRCVVGNGDIPTNARVLDNSADTLHIRTHDPDEVLTELAKRGLVDVLLEGGPRVAAAFARVQRIDRLLVYFAPKLLGAGPTALADIGVTTISDAQLWDIEEAAMSGTDVRISAVPLRSLSCSPG